MKPLNDLLVGYPTNKHAILEQKKKKKRKKKKKKTTKKFASWLWRDSQQCAFDTLKEKFSSPPVLAYAYFSKPLIVHTDASSKELGAVLYQKIWT